MLSPRQLGNSGVNIDALTFGAWAMGGLGYGDAPAEEGLGAVEAFLDRGGRSIDTARGYGISEILVGKVLKAHAAGDEVFVASKSGSTHPPIIVTDFETSRFCLQRDVIDLYYIHVPPADGDHLDRMLDVYQKLKASGKLRFVGVSQGRPSGPESVAEIRRYLQDPRIDVVQIMYSLARQSNAPILAEAEATGTALAARMVLEGGLLTGKYKPGHHFPDKANDWRAGRSDEQKDAMFSFAEELKARFVHPPYTTLPQLAVAWTLAAPGLTTVLVCGRTAAQVEDTMQAAHMPPMPRDTWQAIADLGAPMTDLVNQR